MPEEGHYVICDKCNIWYHPTCGRLDVNEILESGISYFCKKCLNPIRKKKKDNFTVDNHTVLNRKLQLLYAQKVIYVSCMFLSNFQVNILQKCQQ